VKTTIDPTNQPIREKNPTANENRRKANQEPVTNWKSNIKLNALSLHGCKSTSRSQR
jgi:hypothetical protein